MRYKRIQKNSRFWVLTILIEAFLLINSCNKNIKENVKCPGLIPSECNLIFERGFSDTDLSVKVNGKVYFKGKITTDESIEVALHITMDSDTVKSLVLSVDNKETVKLCPYHIVTVNYRNNNLTVKSLKDFPVYE